jgi:hypothetical protein
MEQNSDTKIRSPGLSGDYKYTVGILNTDAKLRIFVYTDNRHSFLQMISGNT